MASFETMLLIGVGLLFITLVFANEGLPSVCSDDGFVCPDGSVVFRDALNDCEFFECPNLDLLPYCTEGVESVEVTDGLIRTVSSVPGAGFSVYGLNLTQCPTISPNLISDECRELVGLDWTLVVNCSSVDYWVYNCTSDAFVRGEYTWINCEPGLFPEFEQFCKPAYRQWIKLNCDIDIIN